MKVGGNHRIDHVNITTNLRHDGSVKSNVENLNDNKSVGAELGVRSAACSV